MPVLQLSWEGDGSGYNHLKLEPQGLFFSGELINALEEVLMTSRVSADITSHKVAGVTHRGRVAAGSLITFWEGCAILKPGGGTCEAVGGR